MLTCRLPCNSKATKRPSLIAVRVAATRLKRYRCTRDCNKRQRKLQKQRTTFCNGAAMETRLVCPVHSVSNSPNQEGRTHKAAKHQQKQAPSKNTRAIFLSTPLSPLISRRFCALLPVHNGAPTIQPCSPVSELARPTASNTPPGGPKPSTFTLPQTIDFYASKANPDAARPARLEKPHLAPAACRREAQTQNTFSQPAHKDVRANVDGTFSSVRR